MAGKNNKRFSHIAQLAYQRVACVLKLHLTGLKAQPLQNLFYLSANAVNAGLITSAAVYINKFLPQLQHIFVICIDSSPRILSYLFYRHVYPSEKNIIYVLSLSTLYL